MSGSAFRMVVSAKAENFKLLSGTPKTYVKTAESGNKRAQVFCPECGTHLYATSVTDQKIFGIRASTADECRQLIPKRQIWSRSAFDWVKDMDAIPRIDKQA
jgi:hypothetical protein